MSQAPLTRTIDAPLPAVAQGATESEVVGDAPFTGDVSGVTVTFETAITGADTNTRLIELVNKGADGTGTTVVASKQFDSGIDAAAFDEVALTLSGTATDLDVTAGDVLAIVSTAVGTGLAQPAGSCEVTIDRE